MGAAAARIKLRPFIAATLIGQAPSSYVYAGIGAASSIALAGGTKLEFARMLGSAQLLVPTVILTVFLLVGILAAQRFSLAANHKPGREPSSIRPG